MGKTIDMLKLRQAIEAAWKPDTAYLEVVETGNPALGQCYPTARVIQHFLPATEIVEGEVLTSNGPEKHFWNLLTVDGASLHIDFTWQQFPPGSTVTSWQIRDRNSLNDSQKTIGRVELLLKRVDRHLLD